MDYKHLKDLFRKQEREHPETHLTACITFASFGPEDKKEYPWQSRTYVVSSDNKAFQPDKGGYSIFGSCLDGSDRCLRLDRYIREEHGGKDGWVVENCFLLGYLQIESSDTGGSSAKMFYDHDEATDHMLSRLAEIGALDLEKIKATYSSEKKLFEEGWYGAERDSAWLAGQCQDYHWNIQPVHIYDLLSMIFPEMKEQSDPIA